MLLVSIGSVAVAFFVYYFVGLSDIPEYVALFTSILTAMYAILAEPKAKTEPILRITPLLKQDPKLLRYNVDIWIENIGYSIAKDIEVKFKVSDPKIHVKNNGFFKHLLLAPKETIKCQALELIEYDTYNTQQLITEVSYLSEDNKKQKPIKKEYPIREMEQGFREVKTS